MFRFVFRIALLIGACLAVGDGALARVDLNTRVVRVYSNHTQVLLRFEHSVTSAEGCPGSAENWAIIDGVPNEKEMLQIALAAYLSGKPVSVRLSGCNHYPIVHSIQLT
jgi:hypothetical protein